MSYKINKTDGTLLVDLVDGQLDNSSTDLTLVGKNYKGFGEFINENYVKLLENFSNSTAPATPIKGQLWYDTAEERLKIYTGTVFKIAGGPILGSQQPSNLVEGDLWVNTSDKRLYFFDGTNTILVGPNYTSSQGKTNFEAFTTVDTTGQARTVLLSFVGGVLFGLLSRETFRVTANTEFSIPGYPVDAEDTETPRRQFVQKGFNLVDQDYIYRGVAQKAKELVDEANNSYSAENFIRSDEADPQTGDYVEQQMRGSLFVKGTTGVAVGVGDTKYATFKVDQGTTDTTIELQQPNYDFKIEVRKGNNTVDAIKIDTSEEYVGLWNSNPTAALDVTGDGKVSGDFTIGGDLTVNGDTINVQVSTLQSLDKNLELGYIQNDDSSLTEGNDASIDNGGLIIVSSNGSKDLTWKNATGNWTSNQDFDLVANKAYKINNSTVLTSTSLGSGVTSALGLTNVGTLNDLNATALTLTTGNITTSSGITITAGGDIALATTQKITNVTDPTSAQDVATKAYVDAQLDSERIVFGLDITSFTDPGVGADGPYNDVKDVLQQLYPANLKAEDSIARIMCSDYSSSTTTIDASDINGARSRTFIAVDSAGTQNESVLQDIAFNTISNIAVTLTITRKIMQFRVNGSGSWEWVSTTAYP